MARRACTVSISCWSLAIFALFAGLILFFFVAAFPTSPTTSPTDGGATSAPSAWGTFDMSTEELMQKGKRTLMTLTQEIWVSTAAVLILVCLGLVTIMLCGMSAENIARLLTVIAALIMVGVSVGFYFRPDLLEKGIGYIKDMGLWGNLLMCATFVVISFPLTIGCVVLAMCCGFIYQFWVGAFTACLGLFVGGWLAFLLCSKLLKRPVLKYAKGKPKLAAILKALRENGWYVSIALRISPVPLGLQNGLLAVTVPFSTFMGSLPFAFPEQVLFAYFGREANQLMDLIAGKQVHPAQVYLMVFDVVVGLLLFGGTVYFGKKIVNRAMDGKDLEALSDVDEEDNSEEYHV